eukprot:9871707-Alexandrium_andersonii.AAC.1
MGHPPMAETPRMEAKGHSEPCPAVQWAKMRCATTWAIAESRPKLPRHSALAHGMGPARGGLTRVPDGLWKGLVSLQGVSAIGGWLVLGP